MAKKLKVEFRYFDRSTCSRCKATDQSAEKAVRDLKKELKKHGIDVEFKATRLPARRLAESNSVLINGRDAEQIISGKSKPRETNCRGCGTLLEGRCDCRAYTYKGRQYRHIPKAMIREAVRKACKLPAHLI